MAPAASLVLLVASFLAARPEPAPDGRRVEVRVHLAPVPPPKALPFVGEPGTDDDGYPLQAVDGAALRSLLTLGRHDDLTGFVERLQVEFEADPRREAWPLEAAWALGSGDWDTFTLLDGWVRDRPNSFAPHLARGMAWVSAGWSLRGFAAAAETSEAQFASMAWAFERAERDLRRAIALRPALAAARVGLVSVALAMGDQERRRQAASDAIASCPACYAVRQACLAGLAPRWGGSHEEMAAIARAALDVPNPRFRWLAASVEFDRSDSLTREGRYPEALEAAHRACEVGSPTQCLLNRAAVERQMGDHDAALRDAERALALCPTCTGALLARSRGLARQRKFERAASDAIAVWRVDPVGGLSQPELEHLVKGLVHEAWQHQEAGRPDDALRVYDVAGDLAPKDPDVLRWRSLAILGPAGATREALEQAREAARQAPDDFARQRRLGYVLLRRRLGKEALALWAGFLERNPQHARARLEYATALAGFERYGEAVNEAMRGCWRGSSEACGWVKALIRPVP